MMNLVRAELLKIRTTRTAWGMLIGLVAITLLALTLQIVNYEKFDDSFGEAPLDGEAVGGLFGGSAAGILLILVLGVIGGCGERRHGTDVVTYLTTPVREKVMAARLISYPIIGLVLSAAALAVAGLVALPWASVRGAGFEWTGDTTRVVGAILLVTVLYSVLGVGLGTLVRNQVAGIVLVILWALLLESLIGALLSLVWDDAQRFLPIRAAGALIIGGDNAGDFSTAPSTWSLIAVVVGWAAVASIVAVLTSLRADVD